MKKIIKGFVDVPAEELADFIEALPLHTKLTNEETGCQYFRVTADPEIIGRFRVEEAFDDETSYQVHVNRVRATDWFYITRNISRSYKIS